MSYVRLLQARIKVLEQVLSLHSIDQDSSVARLTAQGTLSAASLAAISEPLSSGQSSGEIHGELYFNEEPEPVPDGEARYYGLASGRIELRTSETVEPQQPSWVAPTDSPLVARSADPSESYFWALGLDVEVPEEVIDHLVALYFEWEQPWNQVVDEDVFRRDKKSQGRFFSPLLLNCILAVASRYSDWIEVRSNPADVDTAGRPFLQTAEALLHFDMKKPSITTIQSLAILGTYYVAIGSDAAGWLHHGMAIRLALDMGLNMDASSLAGSTRIASEEVILRRQIYWALYSTDKLWASYTGRVCTMLESQGAVELPTEGVLGTHQTAQSNSSTVKRIFLNTLHRAQSTLCQILENILINLYGPRPLINAGQRIDFFDSCLVALKGWYYALSQELRIPRQSEGNFSPHAYILNMVYHTCVILLSKPFLASSALDSSPEYGNTKSFEEVKCLCLDAARGIYTLCEKYRQMFGSFRKSPLSATHCTLWAAMITIQMPTANNNIHDTIPKIDVDSMKSYIKTLQELSDSWAPPRRYWRLIVKRIEKRFQVRLPMDSALYRSSNHQQALLIPELEINQPYQGTQSDYLDPRGMALLFREGLNVDPNAMVSVTPDFGFLDKSLRTELRLDLASEHLAWDFSYFESLRDSP